VFTFLDKHVDIIEVLSVGGVGFYGVLNATDILLKLIIGGLSAYFLLIKIKNEKNKAKPNKYEKDF